MINYIYTFDKIINFIKFIFKIVFYYFIYDFNNKNNY